MKSATAVAARSSKVPEQVYDEDFSLFASYVESLQSPSERMLIELGDFQGTRCTGRFDVDMSMLWCYPFET